MCEKVAIVTGAAGGIGLAIAQGFASLQYHVVLLDLYPDKINAVLEKFRTHHVTGIVCDVTNEAAIMEIFCKIHDQFGRIDVLVNNAGLQFVAPVESFPTEKFRYMLDVMLTAPFIAIKHILPYMKPQHFGRIINMASVNGLIGFAGKAAYNSAKHGLIGLTKVVALETATHGITANAVCPGYVDTDLIRHQLADLAAIRGVPEQEVLSEVIYPLIPQKRLLSPEEVAAMVLFIADEKSGGITGQSFVIDGGYTVQ